MVEFGDKAIAYLGRRLYAENLLNSRLGRRSVTTRRSLWLRALLGAARLTVAAQL